MVIDDSIVIRKMIEIALEDEDFNIVTAISGKEALEAINRIKPNLVILDMLLPDMSGIDVLKTIKEENKLPVIMLSGKDSPQLIESAKELGVDDFLPKPFRDEELVEKVKTLVGD
jgi:DNA-binding response OmpR family regulator